MEWSHVVASFSREMLRWARANVVGWSRERKWRMIQAEAKLGEGYADGRSHDMRQKGATI